ncbi:hypothetical protein JMJ55_11425 [Belnapia sp. T6]|uniref:Uncharacterized protein n=1 Tax=Belnapia mucosa TaxID=2804532 RepID=A0ABS1V2M4_9PROT|nr:hypothetical protein [Belnapia mucosa]MBL6455936.1 hypothetical protein [Belnapia mucosa]
MASIETFRAGPPAPAAPVPEPRTEAALPDPAAFRCEDRLTGLLAFALAAERGEPAAPEAVSRLQREAEAALCDHALRYLHNNVERLRQEAVAEQLGRLRRPPGFLRLMAANLAAMALVALAGGWLAMHPETLAGITGLLAG